MSRFNAAFWRWFGDSKVVDADGQPLVVYHGTVRAFVAFERIPERAMQSRVRVPGAFFFSSSPGIASSYAMSDTRARAEARLRGAREIEAADQMLDDAAQAVGASELDILNNDVLRYYQDGRLDKKAWRLAAVDKWGSRGGAFFDAYHRREELLGWRSRDIELELGAEKQPEGTGGHVIPVYLSLQNPAVVEWEGAGTNWRRFYGEIERAREAGHDGVIVRDIMDSGSTEVSSEFATTYVAFSPTQIKSTHNRGTWSRTDPDIRHNPGVRRGWWLTPRDELYGVKYFSPRSDEDGHLMFVLDHPQKFGLPLNNVYDNFGYDISGQNASTVAMDNGSIKIVNEGKWWSVGLSTKKLIGRKWPERIEMAMLELGAPVGTQMDISDFYRGEWWYHVIGLMND